MPDSVLLPKSQTWGNRITETKKLKLLAIDINDERYMSQAPVWQENGFEPVRVKGIQAAIEVIYASKEPFAIIGINADGFPYLPMLPILRDIVSCSINILTSNFTIDEYIQALYNGADYYAAWKSPEDSVALAKAMVQRTMERGLSKQPIRFFSYQNIFVCLTNRKVYVNGLETERFTRKEFDLISLLISDYDRVYTYMQIFRQVWGDEYIDNDNAQIWSMVKRIRTKLRINDAIPEYISNVKDVGYVFDTF